MPKTIHQLSPTETADFIRTVRGELPGVPNPSNAALARRFDITESAVHALRTAATTTPPKKASAPTRTIAEATREHLIYESAEGLVRQANAAEEKGLEHASHQELAAVAALVFPR